MLAFSQKKLEIVQCDNGFAVEWRDEKLGNENVWTSAPRPATNGVLIFKTKKELLAYIQKFYIGTA